MRDRLKEITEEDYWVHGLSERDFYHIYDLVKKFISLSQAEVARESAEAVKNYPDSGINCEIISDISHYAWCEEQYLWEFCLWRLQGIFEGLFVNNYIDKMKYTNLVGLNAKIKAAKDCGFKISDEDVVELKSWANLRNALSHAPPEQYRPVPLEENDIIEYIELVKRILSGS